MTSLSELRRTLDQHAHEIHDDGAAGRAHDVHARVRRVRQRRIAAVAGAAVVAVVGALVVPPLAGEGPRPAGRMLLGQPAPAEMTALGYTYAFEEGVDNRDGSSTVTLERADRARLLTWAAEDSDAVRLVAPDSPVRVSRGVRFDDWLVVPPGASGNYTVRGSATAVAVYTVTEDSPAGISADGITFREEVAGRRLLGAAIGNVGTGELTVSFEAPGGEVMLSSFCSGGQRGVWVHIDFAGETRGFSSGPGCGEDSFDPGGGGGSSRVPPGRPGERVTARIYLTDGAKGPRVDPAEVRLGLGIYSLPDSVEVVPGYGASPTTEADGHRWRLDRVERSSDGRLSVTNPGSSPLLVEGSFAGSRGSTVLFDDGHSGGGLYAGVGNGGGMSTVLAAPGQSASLRVRGTPPSGLRMGFAVYVRDE